jgi:hypothetical protein
LERWPIPRVNAGHAAQRHDLGFPQILGVDLVFATQALALTRQQSVTGRADGGGRHATDQRDVLLLASLAGQLKARLPGTDALAASQGVDLLLGRHTRGGMGVKYL